MRRPLRRCRTAAAFVIAVAALAATAAAAPVPVRIVAATFSQRVTVPPGPAAYAVTETVRLRVCSVSKPTAAIVTERRRRGTTVVASGSFSLRLAGGAGCTRHTVSWQLANRFVGAGTYRITIRIRDAAGHASAPVAKAYVTSR